MKIQLLLSSLLFIYSATAFAQTPKPDVFDFESDVIEGQKKAPELFLQLEMESTDLSAVLYDRKNFNDFSAVDLKRRSLLSKPKL